MATSVYAELEVLLNKICDVYESIEACLIREREALINFDFTALKSVNVEKEDLARRVHFLESERESLLEEFQYQLNMSQEPLKLAQLIPRVPELWREKIGHVTERLDEVITSCAERFEANKKFIEHSLKNIRSLSGNYQRLVTGTTETYSRQGVVKSAPLTVVRKRV